MLGYGIGCLQTAAECVETYHEGVRLHYQDGYRKGQEDTLRDLLAPPQGPPNRVQPIRPAKPRPPKTQEPVA